MRNDKCAIVESVTEVLIVIILHMYRDFRRQPIPATETQRVMRRHIVELIEECSICKRKINLATKNKLPL